MLVAKAEFRRRLLRVHRAIERFLSGESSGDLFPSLFSLYSYLWCKSSDEVVKSLQDEFSDLPF